MRTLILATVLLLPAAGQPAARELAARAEARFVAGDYKAAAGLFEQYAKLAPKDFDARVRLGWAYYRSGNFRAAADAFAAVLAEEPRSFDAATGAGYAQLQLGNVDAAGTHFVQVAAAQPNNADAQRGVILAAQRKASPALRAAALSAGATLQRNGAVDDQLAAALLAIEGVASRRRQDGRGTGPLAVNARAGRDYLELRNAKGEWEPFFVKAFNLGAAMPGRFPTEFPTEPAVYRQWLATMSDLGANAIRTYTLLPPQFYEALAAHNSAAGARPIRLIQGVWTELPPRLDFMDAAYMRDFQGDIERVIDAVHGNVIVAERPGHASGVYRADVSRWLLAYVIGREWESFAVKHFNALRPGESSFEGKWLRARGGAAMEAWVARVCDYAANYEAVQYAQLHPLTFANWPTLDPLPHPTEADRAEEDAWRKKLGLPTSTLATTEIWEDDAVSLDSTKIAPTERMTAGFFAAYHIYPNYPDFMNLEPSYESDAASGVSRYGMYLRALKKYHGSQPVLVAEFGMSTSRGIAHVAPHGWHHGGTDEREQGTVVAQMIREIHRERYAGAAVFAFMDEWFKGTWSTAAWELPEARRPLWLNVESPEQMYGVVAHRPGSASIVVDGDAADWKYIAPLMQRTAGGEGSWSDVAALSVTSDEAYVYLLLSTRGAGKPLDWNAVNYSIAVDTYAADRGERQMPNGAAVGSGVEFLVTLGGPDKSRLAVTPGYGAHRAQDFYPLSSPVTPTGRFVPLTLESNRERFARNGTRYPGVTIERGALRFGSCDPRSPEYDSRTDVAVGKSSGTIEIRIPWALLNVSDPSSRAVLHSQGTSRTTTTDGFRFYVASSTKGKVASVLPQGGSVAPAYSWRTWEVPKFRTELKEGAAAIRRAMNEITRIPE